jgi:hypothetical protein
VEEIKMKNEIMFNASLCLLDDHSKDMMFYLLLHVRWVDIIIYIRRKIERGEKH